MSTITPSLVSSSGQNYKMTNICNLLLPNIKPHQTTIVNFSKRKALIGLKEAKDLGITFDPRLTWNKHLQKVSQTAYLPPYVGDCCENWRLQKYPSGCVT